MNQLSISERARDLLYFIARTGFYCEHFNKSINVSDFTITKLINNGVLEYKNPMLIFGKMMGVYILSKSGIKTVKKQLLIRPYKPSVGGLNQLEHDFILGKVYERLNKVERDTWITETDLAILYPEGTVVDGLYTNMNGNKVGVEILTNTYSKSIIEDKMKFIDKYCDKKIVVNTTDIK